MEDVIPIRSIKSIMENHIFYTTDRAEWRAWHRAMSPCRYYLRLTDKEITDKEKENGTVGIFQKRN